MGQRHKGMCIDRTDSRLGYDERGSKWRPLRSSVVLWAGLLAWLCVGFPARALEIVPQNVNRLAVYGVGSDFGRSLAPNQLVFNVTGAFEIATTFSSIEFSVRRDCSDFGARTNAWVYVEFQDGSVEVYELFGMWTHFSRVGQRGSCYYVGLPGQELFLDAEQ